VSTGPTYSKKHVNRCARYVRDFVPSAPDDPDWQELFEAIDAIDWWRAQHAKPLGRVNAGLRYYVKRSGAVAQDVTQRLKRFDTIIDKLYRHPNMALTTMEDIGGVRVILDNQRQVDYIASQLQAQPKWKIRRVREYLEGRNPGPKEDGYRAVHVVVVRDDRYVEIQLRTGWQDTWAQSVEEDTRRLRAGLKFGAGPADLREYYATTSEFFAMRERQETPEQEFLEGLGKLFRATRRYFPDDAEEEQSR